MSYGTIFLIFYLLAGAGMGAGYDRWNMKDREVPYGNFPSGVPLRYIRLYCFAFSVLFGGLLFFSIYATSVRQIFWPDGVSAWHRFKRWSSGKKRVRYRSNVLLARVNIVCDALHIVGRTDCLSKEMDFIHRYSKRFSRFRDGKFLTGYHGKFRDRLR